MNSEISYDTEDEKSNSDITEKDLRTESESDGASLSSVFTYTKNMSKNNNTDIVQTYTYFDMHIIDIHYIKMSV